MSQAALDFDAVPVVLPERDFDGATYAAEYDRARLNGQLGRVYRLMQDGRWRTLAEIRERVGGTEAAVSARLRDLRKARWGGFVVDKRRRGEPSHGLYEYQLRVPGGGL